MPEGALCGELQCLLDSNGGRVALREMPNLEIPCLCSTPELRLGEHGACNKKKPLRLD